MSPAPHTATLRTVAVAAAVCVAPGPGPLPSAASAQEAGAVGESEPSPTVRAVPRRGIVEVDGRLSEEAWARAPEAGGFVQAEPSEGAEPAQATEVRVLYDEDALYVGARLFEADPPRIARQLVRRDEEGQYDYLEVGLDPNLDRQTAYVFRVGASGVERDGFVSESSGGNRRRGPVDVSWNAVWESAVHVDSAGWSVEMRIPLSQIRYESRPGAQRWGINFRRRRLASNSTSHLALMSRTVEGVVNQFGYLTNLELPRSGRRLEVEPYLVSELRSRPVEAGNPFVDATELRPRGGLNLSYGVGSNFTLDATVNPDFGQVEVDPAVVNLTAFETFFPEKRPFFVQDAQIFSFDMSGRRSRLFFSRRIGRDPHGDPPAGADFADVPDRTTILGASKFTGRTQGGLSVGAMVALTPEEEGRAFFAEPGVTRRFVVEPTTAYGVGRLQKDFRQGGTTVGAILTGVDRRFPEGSGLEADLASEAYSGGLDFNHQWGGPNDRRWSLEGYYAATHVRGSREAMLRVQTNPQHYFQRPDAERVQVDSTATSLTGGNWRLQLNRQSAEHWTWAVWAAEITPGFVANDIGFNSSGHRLDGGARVAYQEIEPGPLFRSWRASAFTFHNWRHTLLDDFFSPDQWAQAYKNGRVNLDVRLEFHNNWWVSPQVSYTPQTLSDTQTRGGPLMTLPAERSVELRGSTDPRKPVSLEPNVTYDSRTLGGGRTWEVGLEVALRPASNWELRLEPAFRDETTASQYVTAVEDGGYEPTYGGRYLFADLERTQLSMQTRLNVAFTPDLSLQLFAQPLVSAVDFVSYKQLSRPESFEFDRFREGEALEGSDGVRCAGGSTCELDGRRHVDFDGDGASDHSFRDRDFNFRSLRGNAVLRWEYRPGSILFLVWQHGRQDRRRTGSFDLGRDLDGLFAAPADNTFIVKGTYFLDL